MSGGSLPLAKSPITDFAYTQAGFAYELYAYLDWISRMAVPFTAEAEFLEGWSAIKNVFRKPATAATGSVTCTAVVGSYIPGGTIFLRSDGYSYVCTVDTYFDTTTAQVPVTCQTVGSAGTCAINTSLAITSAIAGVQSTGLASGTWTPGVDQETDAELRTRMLQVYQNPPQGGAASDYVTWALAVSGVTRAWAQSAGNGIVRVYVMLDDVRQSNNGFPVGTPGVASTDPRPGFDLATGDQLAVANGIDSKRPVTALVYVTAPTAYTVDFQVGGLNDSDTTTKATIASALYTVFRENGSALGTTLYPSLFNDALLGAVGNTANLWFENLTPITTPVGQVPVLGTITGMA